MGLGGIEISVSKLALHQQKQGCNVTVVCLYNDGCTGEMLKQKGINVIALNLRRGLGLMNLIIPLLRICWKYKADVLQVHLIGVEIPVAIAVALKAVRKAIITSRCFEKYTGWRYWRAKFQAKVANYCYDKIVCISTALKEHEINHLGRKPDKTIVIWNGVDTELFCPRTIPVQERAAALGLKSIDAEVFVVGTGVQLKQFKDIPTLIRAAVRVKQQRDVLFVVAGLGPLEAELKALAAKLGIQDCFKFVGRMEDMPRFLNAIDLLALTSPFEGLGVIVLEAMAVGKPVITTDSGGVRDSVTNGKTGIVVPVGDDKSLADSIIKLVDDRELGHKMGQAGLVRARKDFTLEKYTQSYWNFIVDECSSSDEENISLASGK